MSSVRSSFGIPFLVLLVVAATLGAACTGRRGGRRPGDASAGTDAGTARPDAGASDGSVAFDAFVPRDAGDGALDVSGEWSGTWASSGLTGSATVALSQDGPTVVGAFLLDGSPCLSSGTVSAAIDAAGLMTGTFESTSESAAIEANATASTLNGSFTIVSGTCSGIGGTFALTR